MLTRLLGVRWTREDVEGVIGRKDKPAATAPNEAFIPLALAINPELMGGLEKMFRVSKGGFIGGGEYKTSTGEDVVNLGDLPPEEFLRWANQATGTMQEVATQIESQQETVIIREGEADDRQINRIREQIAQSKRFR